LFSLVFIFVSCFTLPETWKGEDNVKLTWWYAYYSVSIGLISGFLIGLATDYFTSHDYNPVRRLSKACSSGPAINVIYGLSLGY